MRQKIRNGLKKMGRTILPTHVGPILLDQTPSLKQSTSTESPLYPLSHEIVQEESTSVFAHEGVKPVPVLIGSLTQFVAQIKHKSMFMKTKIFS